jgi:hypothetical protein
LWEFFALIKLQARRPLVPRIDFGPLPTEVPPACAPAE